MARVSFVFCFSIFVAFQTIFNVASAHTNLSKPVPDTVKEIDTFVLTEVMNFITELEKNSPENKEYHVFFQKLKDYVKFACPIASNIGEKGVKINKEEMDDKAGKVFHAMVSVHAGTIGSEQEKETIRKKQMESITKFGGIQDIVVRVSNENNKDEGSKKLTPEQKEAIEKAILEFERTIKQVVKAPEKAAESPDSKAKGSN